jgi:Flp pilus assembly protein TadD
MLRGTPAESERANPSPQQPKREFPASAAQIALEAQRAYNARRYDEAEAKYKQVLSVEDKNVYTLANLAAAQMELNKLSEAEANLNMALGIRKDDAFSMALMGLVKFRKNDFDGALDMLSQAAVLDPDNAQTQNYLGLALSQKGLRIAAEAAFRKAVKLAPGYSVAHYNLAVFYATAEPPSPELARWHYQKATAAGHPKSPELEKLLVAR